MTKQPGGRWQAQALRKRLSQYQSQGSRGGRAAPLIKITNWDGTKMVSDRILGLFTAVEVAATAAVWIVVGIVAVLSVAARLAC